MYPESTISFNKVYAAYYRKSYLFIKSYVHDDMAAEDLASDALIKLWERMVKETVNPVAPYLFTICKNSALDYLKHQAIKRGVLDSINQRLCRELEIRTSALEESDPKDVFSVEVQQIFQSTLESLPDKTKDIYMLSRFGNKPHKEIAEIFGVTVKGVDYHIFQAVKELRIALNDYLPILGFVVFFR